MSTEMDTPAATAKVTLDGEQAESSKLILAAESSDSAGRAPRTGLIRRALGYSTLLAAAVIVVAMSSGVAGKNGAALTVRQTVVPASARDSLVNLGLDECGGPCKEGYVCVIAGTYSQCIDCSPTGNWPYDCPTYDPDFKKAAIESCGMECAKKLPTPANSKFVAPPPAAGTSAAAGGAGAGAAAADDTKYACELGPLLPNEYDDEKCWAEADYSLKVTCKKPLMADCDTMLASGMRTGGGKYSVAMQAAPGTGVATKFFVSSFGKNESRDVAWNSIAFEVLGARCGEKESEIWTTFDAGAFDKTKPEYARMDDHHKWIKVPFDACADWHIYEIYVDEVKIMWEVDGKVYRKETITKFKDLLTSIEKLSLQVHLKVFGQNKESKGWDAMGFFEDSLEEFPISAWFGSLIAPGYDGTDTADTAAAA